MNPVAGMKVIVTGAASGIGRATAELLAVRGAQVLVADRDAARVDEAVTVIGALGPQRAPLGCVMDVRIAADCERMIEFAERRLGEVDALVHSAGILRPTGSRPRPLHEVEEAEYEAVIDTNLKGTFLVNRAVLQAFLPRRRGQIVNLSSTSGRKGRPLDAVYSASKAGVIGLSESIAEEVRSFGIRVQVVLPDAVDTPLWSQNGPISAPPPGSLPAERVAEIILMCLSLPEDTICENLIVAPLKMRVRRKREADGGLSREEL